MIRNRGAINFGEKIKTAREKAGYTQEYVASLLKISQKAFSKIENNETHLKGEVLIRLSEILEADILDLIPQETPLIYNNHHIHKGDGIVYNKENIEKVEELYKKLLDAKDEQIRLLQEMLSRNTK